MAPRVGHCPISADSGPGSGNAVLPCPASPRLIKPGRDAPRHFQRVVRLASIFSVQTTGHLREGVKRPHSEACSQKRKILPHVQNLCPPLEINLQRASHCSLYVAWTHFVIRVPSCEMLKCSNLKVAVTGTKIAGQAK